MVVDLVLAYVGRWAVERARPIGQRVNDGVDRALGAAMDRLHDVVAGKLGGESALQRLEADAQQGKANPAAASYLQQLLEQAMVDDERFARDLEAAVREVRSLDRQPRTTSGRDTVVSSPGAGTTATSSGDRRSPSPTTCGRGPTSPRR